MEVDCWQKFVRLVKIHSKEEIDRDELLVAADSLAETWMRTGDWPLPSELVNVDGFLACVNSGNRLVQHQLTNVLTIATTWLDAQVFNELRTAGLGTGALLNLAHTKWQATHGAAFLLMWPNVDGYSRRGPAGVAEDLPEAVLDFSFELICDLNASTVEKTSCLALWLSMVTTMKEVPKWSYFLRSQWDRMRGLLVTFLLTMDGFMVRTSMQILSSILSVLMEDTVHKTTTMDENDVGFEEILSLWEVLVEIVEHLPSRWFGGISGPEKDPCSIRLRLLIPLQLSALCPNKFGTLIELPWFRRLLDVSIPELIASFSEEDEHLSMLLLCSAKLFKLNGQFESLHPLGLWLQFFESLHFNAESIFIILVGGDYLLMTFLFFLKVLTQHWESLNGSFDRISVHEWTMEDEPASSSVPEPAFTLEMVEVIDGQRTVGRRPVYALADSRKSDSQAPFFANKIPCDVLIEKLKVLLRNLKDLFAGSKDVQPAACLRLIDKVLSQIAELGASRSTDHG
uniref:Protein Lines N-terminal domain-containing protein n=1 Tax=Trichuris muris TaxID=70415 RepID=A0A5S6Q706_TRIMR